MKKPPTRLSATFVKSVDVPGRYGDGRGGLGLTLLVKPSSRRGCRKSWGQSMRINDRKTTLVLGTYPVITLAMARERALEPTRLRPAAPRQPARGRGDHRRRDGRARRGAQRGLRAGARPRQWRPRRGRLPP